MDEFRGLDNRANEHQSRAITSTHFHQNNAFEPCFLTPFAKIYWHSSRGLRHGKWVDRDNGQLTLEDGTLAGADLDLTRAINVIQQDAGETASMAITRAT